MKKTRILIVGAGKDILEFIDLLHKSERVSLVGVVDRDPAAPGLGFAKRLEIPTDTSCQRFINTRRIDTIINVTGDLKVQEELITLKPSGVELLGSCSAKLIGDLVGSVPSASEPKYQSVFQNMLSGVAYHTIITDKNNNPRDYIFLEVNKAFERLIGLKKEEIIGKKVTEILPGIKSSMFDWVNFYGRVAMSGKEIKFEQYLKDLGRWYAVSAYSPRKGYFITIYDDITERKRAEESLRKAYDTLKKTQAQLIQTEKMEVVGKLASGIAHEVKNPLAVILQGVDYLHKKIHRPGKDVRFVLISMNDAVKRASSIISDLLDFSRVSNMQMEPESINSIIRSALLLVKNDIARYRIKVIEDLGQNIPKTPLDKNRMLQVFINLFMNAIQAMPNSGKLRITTCQKREGGRKRAVIVKIEDTGEGIPPDAVDKIFEPFFTTKESGKGTGLGLSIVRNIIEGHNGKIGIENRQEIKGARVTVTFYI